MLKFAVMCLGLVLTACSWSAHAQLMDVAVSGGGIEFGAGVDFTPSGDVLVPVQKTSLAPTVIDFVVGPEAVSQPLTLIKFNEIDEDLSGLAFSLEGAFFAAAPQAAFGPGVGTLVGLDNTEALFLAPLSDLGVTSLNLLIDFEAGTPAALTVTPVVPEPATGALVLGTLLLAGRRGRG